MLDDLKYIHQRDSADTLGLAEKQWQHLGLSWQIAAAHQPICQIVCLSAGSMAVVPDLVQRCSGLNVACVTVSDELPPFVSNETLVVLLDYDGQNREGAAAFLQAQKIGARCAVITADPELLRKSEANGALSLPLPAHSAARFTLLAGLKAFLVLTAQFDLLSDPKALVGITAVVPRLETALQTWLPTVPAHDNPAKQLARELIGVSLVICAGPKLAPAAMAWKLSLNETAKQVAWTSFYPDAMYGELTGWSEQPVDKPYRVIEFRSNLEDASITEQQERAERVLSGRRPAPIVVTAEDDSDIMTQLLWFVIFGSFVAIYTALLAGNDPISQSVYDKLRHK